MRYAEQMAASTNQVDKRFLNLYIYRKTAQHNIRLGLKNDMLLSNNRRVGDKPDEFSVIKSMLLTNNRRVGDKPDESSDRIEDSEEPSEFNEPGKKPEDSEVP